MKRSSRAGRWELSRAALDRLLLTLDPDREAASRRYEALRERLIDLFAWEGAEAPEALADETFNRLARRLLEGVSLEGPAVERYAFGIARFQLQEDLRAQRGRERAVRDQPRHGPDTDRARLFQQLDRCLASLPRDSRELIERYYAGDRAALAGALGLTVNALRNRALRIRQQLHECLARHGDI
jgi:DNA-directed RNA polymerase specialized sigma24 family protein